LKIYINYTNKILEEKDILKYLKYIKISFKYFLQLRLLQSWWHSWYRLHYPRLFV